VPLLRLKVVNVVVALAVAADAGKLLNFCTPNDCLLIIAFPFTDVVKVAVAAVVVTRVKRRSGLQ